LHPFYSTRSITMQSHTAVLLLFSLFAGAAATTRRSLATRSEAVARRWLEAHPQVSQDEADLKQLKIENPDAFAVVNALLTKQRLGLLDPKHPSASFANSPSRSEDEPSGAAAFAKFMKPGELSRTKPAYVEEQSAVTAAEPTAPYTHMDRPGPKDWLSWRPPASADDNDAAAVQHLLGAVASIKRSESSANLFQKSRAGADQNQPTQVEQSVQASNEDAATARTSLMSLKWNPAEFQQQPMEQQPIQPLSRSTDSQATMPQGGQKNALAEWLR